MASPTTETNSESIPTLSDAKDGLAQQTTRAAVSMETPITESHEENPIATSSAAAKDKKHEKRGMFASYQHSSCLRRIKFASKQHPDVKVLLEALEKLGREFVIEKQVSCERCTTTTNVSGGFDPINNQIIVCENRSPTQRLTSMLLNHELIHAYDNSRAEVDWTDLKAVACSEIRAANLSGDCSFLSEKFYRGNIGAKYNHEACVKRLAVSSIIATRDVPREEAEKIVDGVWENCYHDYAPFPDVPHRASDMKFSRFSKYYQPR